MRPRLPENAREAFQFLALGAGIVLSIRLLGAVISGSSPVAHEAGLIPAAAPFNAAYPLLQGNALAVESLEPLPRIAIASLFTLLSGGMGALLGALLGKLTRKGALRHAVLLGRAGLMVAGAWALWTLLALPRHCTIVKTDGLHCHEHICFMDRVPLPFTGTERVIPWSAVLGIETVERIESVGCGLTVMVRATLADGSWIVAMQPRATTECDSELARQRRDAEIIVREIKAFQRQHL